VKEVPKSNEDMYQHARKFFLKLTLIFIDPFLVAFTMSKSQIYAPKKMIQWVADQQAWESSLGKELLSYTIQQSFHMSPLVQQKHR
jgi:hypothetical protein